MWMNGSKHWPENDKHPVLSLEQLFEASNDNKLCFLNWAEDENYTKSSNLKKVRKRGEQIEFKEKCLAAVVLVSFESKLCIKQTGQVWHCPSTYEGAGHP